jgi:hypothetical protein
VGGGGASYSLECRGGLACYYQVEEERDQKTEHFIQAAKEICGRSAVFIYIYLWIDK